MSTQAPHPLTSDAPGSAMQSALNAFNLAEQDVAESEFCKRYGPISTGFRCGWLAALEAARVEEMRGLLSDMCEQIEALTGMQPYEFTDDAANTRARALLRAAGGEK